MFDIEHPIITCACRTGYAPGQAPENGDAEEGRREYLEEHMDDFMDWLRAGDQDVIDRFFEEHARSYLAWLN